MYYVHKPRGCRCLVATFFTTGASSHNFQSLTGGAKVSLGLSGPSGRAVCAICWIGSLSALVSNSSLIKTETFLSTLHPSLAPYTALLIPCVGAERSRLGTGCILVPLPFFKPDIYTLGTLLTSKRSIIHIQNINFYNIINNINYNHLDGWNVHQIK